MRRLLLSERLYGVKIGNIWVIYPTDLEAFKRMRRPPGRPPKLEVISAERASIVRIAGERRRAGTNRYLRRRRPNRT